MRGARSAIPVRAASAGALVTRTVAHGRPGPVAIRTRTERASTPVMSATRTVPSRASVAHARTRRLPPAIRTGTRRVPRGAARANASIPKNGGRASAPVPRRANGAYTAPSNVWTAARSAPARTRANRASVSQSAAAKLSLAPGEPPHGAEFSSATQSGSRCAWAIATSGSRPAMRSRDASVVSSFARLDAASPPSSHPLSP